MFAMVVMMVMVVMFMLVFTDIDAVAFGKTCVHILMFMVMMMVLMFLLILVVIVVMMVFMFLFILIMVMMVMMFVFFLFFVLVFTETFREAVGASGHRIKDRLSAELIPRGGDDAGFRIQFPDDRNVIRQFVFITNSLPFSVRADRERQRF